MTDVTSAPTDSPTWSAAERFNARIAVEFLGEAVAGRSREAWRRFGSPDFVHHNPWFRSDADSLIDAMTADARANPGKTLEVRHTVVDGPFVAVHSRVRPTPKAPDVATVHLFRIEDGRIRELWDVAQETPPDSPNELGQF